ncbi:tetratricopeptide repeat protein [Crossiella cryophila]|uniref:Tetratricopeptide (TPR) repeat protein n=1 Tax=Crossiella cryophila TaxID=43355 RepID=A0A7W7CF59_9PSEU|nr:tetratricopeptide repeat protein [Crossiella cryophila]MBB4680095.1 tetratricopeptide (TPR) repeat protein [Crossiella cryophila]
MRNEVSGTAHSVVQAGVINSVILSGAPADPELPQLVSAQAPRPPETYTNRDEELARVRELAGTPLGGRTGPMVAAVHGMVGMGKTAFLRQAAWQLGERYPDGVLHVQYGTEGNSPGEAAARFLAALGVPESRIPASFEARGALFRSLSEGLRLLAVFDDVRDAAQVTALLPNSAGSLVLVSAGRQEILAELYQDREVLDVALEPLRVEHGISLVAKVCGAERVAAERAAVVELVTLCGGLPLALGVAAAWLKARPHLEVGELVEDLRETDLDPGDPSTERSARAKVFAMFDRVYDDLSESARRLYRLLSVLVGAHFGVEVLAAMLDQPVRAVRRDLDELCQTGMVQAEPGGVHRLHRLVRVHALRVAEVEDGKAERIAALRQAVRWWLIGAAAADVAVHGRQPLRVTDPASVLDDTPVAIPAATALAWLRREQTNLVDIMAAAAEQGWHTEVCQLFEATYTLFDATKPLATWVRAGKLAVDSAVLLGNAGFEARCRCLLAKAYQELGRFAEAHEHLDRARELAGDWDRLLGSVEDFTGNVLLREGRAEQALGRFRTALEINERLGLTRGTALQSMMVGRALGALGRYEEALLAFGRSRELLAGTDATSVLLKVQLSAAVVLAASGADRAAEHAYAEVLATAEERGATAPAADALLGLAELAERRADRAVGVEFRERAAGMFERMGSPRAATIARVARQLAGLPATA